MNQPRVKSINLLVLALLMVGTSICTQKGSQSNKPKSTNSALATTVRKLMGVIVDGIKELYRRVGSLNGRVNYQNVKQNRLRELVMKQAQGLNLTSAKLTKTVDGHQLSIDQVQMELMEGTFAINQTIHNRSAPIEENAVHIVGGGTRGRVQVKYLGEWTLICDDEWTQEDATVVCGMLGMANDTLIWAYKEQAGQQMYVKLDKVACAGDEKYVINCPHIGTSTFHVCENNNVAAVECRTPDTRLVGGGNGTIGRLEVKYNGVWGTVCDDGFDHHNARVVCASLQLPSKLATAHDGYDYSFSGSVASNMPIWLDEVDCNGNESSISECDHPPFGTHDCSHAENVGVKCA